MEPNNLEKLVEELRSITPFKDSTEVGDVVLIASEQPRLILYAKVTAIDRDPSQKDLTHSPDDRSGNIHHGR